MSLFCTGYRGGRFARKCQETFFTFLLPLCSVFGRETSAAFFAVWNGKWGGAFGRSSQNIGKRPLLQRSLPKQWIISSFSDSINNSTSTLFLSGGKLGEFFLLPLLEFLRSGENPAGGRGEGREKDWSGKERGRMESNLSVKERRGRGGGGGRRHCTHAGPREQNGSKQAKERALFPLFFRARGEEGAAVKWIG